MKVSLFVTCLTDTFYPRTAIATVKVLEHLGCVVDFPEAQTCCGQPMFNNGFEEDSRELAKNLIEAFEGAEYVITPSGSCAAMIRDHYVEMFHDDPAWHDAAARFAAKTYEFIEFLVKVKKVDLASMGCEWKGKTTYHYSCHLRGIGVKGEAVDVIKQIKGLEFVPLEKADQCCGFGGTFALNYPEISGTMARDKAQCIKNTGATTIVSNDAGCTMNISGMCRREKVDIEFKSLAEIIAEGLGLMPKTA